MKPILLHNGAINLPAQDNNLDVTPNHLDVISIKVDPLMHTLTQGHTDIILLMY